MAAGFATLWAALLSYLPVAAVIGLARTLEGAGRLGGAARAGLAGWLLGHGVVGTPIGPLGLAPLLLTLLIVWRLNRAGLHVTRAIGRAAAAHPATRCWSPARSVSATRLLGAVAALLISGPRHGDPGRPRRDRPSSCIGAAGALIGSVRGTGALAALSRQHPAGGCGTACVPGWSPRC